MPTRKTPQRPARRPARPKSAAESARLAAALDAEEAPIRALAAELSGKARTIIYVHGIGNKPVASVLKCQWDNALFQFDLGERSRMAYWVDRTRYPTPEAGSCDSGDLVEADDDPSVKGLRVQSQLAALSLEDEVAELADTSEQRRTLLAIAEKLAASEPPVSESAIRAQAVEAKILPLPKPLRELITRKLTKQFLRDVNDLFFVPERRQAMLESVRERLRPGGGPYVVIGHSQGSMLAYLTLIEMAAELKGDKAVDFFVTIGSPLGIKEVQDQIKKLSRQAKLKVPSCVKAWLNVADPLDPVAFDKFLAGDFEPVAGVKVVDKPGWNPDSPRHPHSGTGYLEKKSVRTAVREVVDTALFQPVASFVIARDVTRELEDGSFEARHEVLIELSEVAEQGERNLDRTRDAVVAALEKAVRSGGGKVADLELERLKRFVAAKLTREESETLAYQMGEKGSKAVRRIWRNSVKCALLESSANTVQALPAHNAYRALGQGITWAVLDSGIYGAHPHFAGGTIAAQHDCTRPGPLEGKGGTAPDEHGHGTHVAGIIAGLHTGKPAKDGERERVFSGIAPQARIVAYKVLDRHGSGKDAWIIKALDHIAETNELAGEIVLHGVNLSLGGSFDPSSYACGHSPLCRELRRLWRQGVVVVTAAGNEGFAMLETTDGVIQANMALSIGDPANLEEAIAVGSVHKDNPHTYGVSYFSSRGPTADGRQKPDLVAPGERILSCRHKLQGKGRTADDLYVAMSGTSMAAPHVSGVIAAFLSLRREFIGDPDRVKKILLGTCTDLSRVKSQQGAGLPNLVKMLVTT